MEEIRNDFLATERKQDDMLIRVQGLSKSYGAKRALDQINLNIGRGKIVGLLGPNGSGKTTFIKLLNGLLRPNEGILLVNGYAPGVETKSIISYLPDRMYFADWMKTVDLMDLFSDFYADFDRQKAAEMFSALNIRPLDRIKAMSKGTKEKVQLVLVMSRKAQLYLLDEPIAGVDPAARDFILDTILTNYNENGTVMISTHLISDIERVLDEVVFLQNGQIARHDTVDYIRETEGKSVDQLFREVFRAVPYQGGDF
ncbi:MAG: ABC transporter ATP-binding protein [Butyricicoccus sp.]|nr:ABC transporter ATP-binding protein [Butyricicoccus pullicaecorum]